MPLEQHDDLRLQWIVQYACLVQKLILSDTTDNMDV